MVSRARQGTSIGVALVVVGLAAPCSGETKVRGCGWLDQEALRRHVELELASVRDELRDLEVDFACGGDDVTIGLSAGERGIRVERRIVDVCCEGVEVERELALLAVGLVRASAPVLAGVETKPEEPIPPAVSPGGEPTPGPRVDPTLAPEEARVESTAPGAFEAPRPAFPAPAFRTPDRASTAATPRHLVGAGARVVFRNLASPTPTYGVSLTYFGAIYPWLSLGPQVSATFGQARRDGGTVALRVVELGGAAAFRLLRGKQWSIRAAALGGLSVVQVAGSASTPNVEDASGTGATGHVGLQLVPAVHGGRFRLMLPLEAGYLFRAPRGLVDDGETVQVDGLWAGAQLTMALQLGEVQ